MSSPVLAADAAHEARTLWAGLLLATVGAIAFSGKAIIVKLAYRHGVDAETLLALRMLMSVPFFVAALWTGLCRNPG